MRRIILPVLLAVCLLFAGCAAEDTAARQHAAATTVDKLLDLRADNVREVTAYEPFFSDPAMAQALVEGSTSETAAATVPKWEEPYVSAVTSDTADVVVRWVGRTGTFESWPEATIFRMSLEGSRWVVVDAVEPDGDVPGALSREETGRF